ncbi:acriflavin resistance protein [Pseudohongiella acticola]|jgi:multidrug efflux pump|uniref:Acriflavin resistance protein n=1 Tax=Pseudohongiella acticola TaxID=1524254 RepID=A0A1E8CI12_9GAMM|nr:efflux RND transporter permease subunit [Pseudohongiella acticola]OFE12091.1 acriflavin resistance protein [Pseudohongiella acticola]
MITDMLLKPRLILMVVIMLTLAGLASFGNMARQEDPVFPARNGLITVLYPGATADALERLILEPLQDEISQVEEVLEYSAIARSGVALLNIVLQDNLYDTDPAWERVRQAMDRARLEFPAGVRQMELDDRVTSNPAVVLALAGDPSVVALSLAAERLKRQLTDLPGLSRIEIEGDVEEQITIAIQDAELNRLGISPAYIANVIGQRNQVSPGGFIVVNNKRISLLSNSEFEDLAALRSTQIALPDASSVPLASIADIQRTPIEPAPPATWMNGERVVTVNVYIQDNQVDAIGFGETLRQRVQEIAPDFAPLKIAELFFQPDQVESRLSDLQGSLLLSMLIITLVVFIGMGWRMGILVAAMLPLVTLISLGVYDLGGGVLHQIAVIGLVISLGILIDNAIVMIENIQNHLSDGKSRQQSMLLAVKELAGPLGASTGTTLAAFTPLLLSSGGTADFTRGIPVMIMLTLSISYLLAISVAPLLAAWFLPPQQARRSAWFDTLGSRMALLSETWPRLIIIGGLTLVIGSFMLSNFLNFQFFPNADRPQVVIEVFLPEGSDQAYTDEISADFERLTRQQANVVSVHRFVGFTGPGFYYNLPNATRAPNRARLVVNMQSLGDTSGLIDWAREHAATSLPEISIVASTLAQGPPRVAPVEVRLYHANNNTRLAAAEHIFRLLKTIPGAVDVRHDIDLGTPVLRAMIDDASAQRHGVSRADVAQTLFARSFGFTAEQYRQELDPIPIVLRSLEGLSTDVSKLLSSYVYNNNGEAIPVSLVARFEADWQEAGIQHRNGVRVYTITAGLANGYNFSQILEVLNERLQEEPLPVGTRMELGGDLEGSGEANQAILSTAPIGILLLLFFLILQFNSFTRVGIILLTVPLAAAGIFPGLVLTGSPFGFQPLLGIIALVGIVVNNAIVLIDRIDQRLKEGANINDAVSDAVTRRTRPILLTTATTVAGLLPLALSASTLWPPMAWAIISGLLASTVQTLLVVPAVCRLTLKPKRDSAEIEAFAEKI